MAPQNPEEKRHRPSLMNAHEVQLFSHALLQPERVSVSSHCKCAYTWKQERDRLNLQRLRPITLNHPQQQEVQTPIFMTLDLPFFRFDVVVIEVIHGHGQSSCQSAYSTLRGK